MIEYWLLKSIEQSQHIARASYFVLLSIAIFWRSIQFIWYSDLNSLEHGRTYFVRPSSNNTELYAVLLAQHIRIPSWTSINNNGCFCKKKAKHSAIGSTLSTTFGHLLESGMCTWSFVNLTGKSCFIPINRTHFNINCNCSLAYWMMHS